FLSSAATAARVMAAIEAKVRMIFFMWVLVGCLQIADAGDSQTFIPTDGWKSEFVLVARAPGQGGASFENVQRIARRTRGPASIAATKFLRARLCRRSIRKQ
ncbi:MAG: hypothetical protein WCF18_13540, partial [Chthoniobacteraceae bacterium]